MDIVREVIFDRAPSMDEFDLLAAEVAKLEVRLKAIEPKASPAPLPTIEMFNATPDTAEVGQPVLLHWVTHNTTAVALGAMAVEPNGSYQVIVPPGPQNNTWTLYASNADGVMVTRDTAITVLIPIAHPSDSLSDSSDDEFTLPSRLFRVGSIRYATLQAALDSMSDGDTLHIINGRPDKANLVLRNISIVSI